MSHAHATNPQGQTSQEMREAVEKELIAGLKDAHAMEVQAKSVMEQQLARLDAYPAFKAQIERHIRETQAQAERLERILETLGTGPSSMKDTFMSILGSGQSATQMLAGDNVIKAAIANQGVEGFEIGAYRSLIQLAHLHGDPKLHQELETSLAEEKAMFAWLEEHIPQVTAQWVENAAK